MLAAPHPLLVHNTGPAFSVSGITTAYKAVGAAAKFRSVSKPLSEDEILRWILHVQ
jgi:hypothetical protein